MEIYVSSKVITQEEAKETELNIVDTVKSTNTISEFCDMISGTLCLELELGKTNAIIMGNNNVLTVTLSNECKVKFNEIMQDTEQWNRFRAIVFHTVADVLQSKSSYLANQLHKEALSIASLL